MRHSWQQQKQQRHLAFWKLATVAPLWTLPADLLDCTGRVHSTNSPD